ncbi:MAG: hypothetical protein V3W04_07145 [Gammaproteobacteria bacterium]
MKNRSLSLLTGALLGVASFGNAWAAAQITAHDGVCTNRSGGGHATTVLFFNKKVKNVIATTNEVQRIAGATVSQDTDLTFDVWRSKKQQPGECIGSIDVHIDGGTNERAEVVIEDLLNTPHWGQGIVVRTGQLDKRSKIDIYVDRFTGRKGHKQRQLVWNNFTGMPNPSREMSTMRFVAGQHLAIYFSGQDDHQATAKIQVFKNDGTFVGVATEKIGEGSVVVTNNTRSLDYVDLAGNPVAKSMLPDDGEGYLKVIGVSDTETEAACMVLFSKSRPNSNYPSSWYNGKLANTTITFARRNASNDPLNLGE